MKQDSGKSPGNRSGLLTISRRQLLGGAMAGAAVATLPACGAPAVEADRTVDVVLIGGGVMSATLGALLRQLEPGWSIEMFERLDAVGLESSNAWHNAGPAIRRCASSTIRRKTKTETSTSRVLSRSTNPSRFRGSSGHR